MLGIHTIHNLNVVHGDIKLENILFGADGCVKIGDFGGCMKLTHKSERLYKWSGTPGYYAPEIKNENGYHGFPVDIWSAGVSLYVLLYGLMPFKCYKYDDLHLVYNQPPIYDCSVSEMGRHLLQSML